MIKQKVNNNCIIAVINNDAYITFYCLGLEAIREGIPELPPFLNEYGELAKTVYALCAVHAMKNAGTTKKTSYAQVRNFCRAATKEERERKLNVLIKNHSTDFIEYILAAEKHIGWWYLHKKFNLQCSFGITNTNGSEVTNNRVIELRAPISAENLEKFCERQSEDFCKGRQTAIEYRKLGKHFRYLIY